MVLNKKCSLNVLLIGRDYSLAWILPQILKRAGFSVDVITSSSLMSRCKFVRNCDVIPPTQSLMPVIIQRLKKNYEWIVITEDAMLAEILESNLSIEDKLKLLPVLKEENFDHLYSKIGLSKVFSAKGVNTPPFFVANNLTEALLGAGQLGYPVLLKIDLSGGGIGIFECHAPSDLSSIKMPIFDKPILVQKKISGIELDLSALYLEGDLVHFSYAKVEKVCWNKFGPSVLRTYHSLSGVDAQIFHELAHIGKVLGAHGFTNITCIESNGHRFYFEVDMRPNAWVEVPRHFGEDPSVRIQAWFSGKEKLSYPIPTLPSQMLIPYFLRLKWFELLFNRYNVWKFIPRDDWKLTFRVLFKKYKPSFRLKYHVTVAIKRMIPKKYHSPFRKLKHLLNF